MTFQGHDALRVADLDGAFDAGFAAFWWSHLSNLELTRFLRGFHAALMPGSVVSFIDNILVPGSSTPISRRDATGNTYQTRQLDDGSSVEVMKNFPTDEQIVAVMPSGTTGLVIERLTYYWIVSYTLTDGASGVVDPHR